MRLFNPGPDFLTSKSFAFQGAGYRCYAFIQLNQCVMASCYMRYNVALRFYSLFSIGYMRLLQNMSSRAHMRACACVRTHMRAPTRVHSCYIATFRFKYINNKEKRVAGSCSRDVVCCSSAVLNKILPIYSAEKFGREMNGMCGQNGWTAVGKITGRRFNGVAKKWLISAVFRYLKKKTSDAAALDVCKNIRVSAVFKGVGTFFLRMFPVLECCKFSPGGSPQAGRMKNDISGSDFFLIFNPFFRFWRSGSGLIFSKPSGVKGFVFFRK